jgi:Ni,Fe-hydrogenase III large subunit
MMEPLEPLLLLSTRELPPLALDTWAQQCAQALAAGARLLTLFGRAAGDEVITTAVLRRPDGPLQVLRGVAKSHQSYPSLSVGYPGAHMFERELWEQTGLTPSGHPWLKPVRYQGARQQSMKDYPFFAMRGQELHEVGVGPIHASVIEPGHFRFQCLGEQVQHLEIQLGYQHRGVEALLLQRPALALTSTIECVVGDSSIAYAWAYCAAMEALADHPVNLQVQLVRGVALELERVAMHLTGLNGLATDIAFLQGGATYGRLRTAIINASMRACGSRFGRGWLRPGGVRFGLTETLRADLLQTLSAFAKDFAGVNALMLAARSVRARFQGVGHISQADAQALGLLGLAARASGVALDARTQLPGQLYRSQPLPMLTETGGDCWARVLLRMREIDASVLWLTQVLSTAQPDADAAALLPSNAALRPDALCVGVCEGFRGEVVQVLETDAAGKLLHYKLQDPSLQNWFGLALCLRNNAISDFPICNKSFDLSYCGNDL